MSKIATWADVNRICGTLMIPTNKCPTQKEILATGKANVSPLNMNENALVPVDRITKRIQSFSLRVWNTHNQSITLYNGSAVTETPIGTCSPGYSTSSPVATDFSFQEGNPSWYTPGTSIFVSYKIGIMASGFTITASENVLGGYVEKTI